MLISGVAVSSLVGAKNFHMGAQIGLVIAQSCNLSRVMIIDYFLHCRGTGHGRMRAQRRGGRTQSEARVVPERRQYRGPHTTLPDQFLESRQMITLLFRHTGDSATGNSPAQNRHLALIDTNRAVFPGMVHADHALYKLLRIGVSRQAAVSGCFSGRSYDGPSSRMRRRPEKVAAANASEKIPL